MCNHSWAQVPPNYIVEKEKNSHMSLYVNRDSMKKWWLITLIIEFYHHVNGTNIITHVKLIPSLIRGNLGSKMGLLRKIIK